MSERMRNDGVPMMKRIDHLNQDDSDNDDNNDVIDEFKEENDLQSRDVSRIIGSSRCSKIGVNINEQLFIEVTESMLTEQKQNSLEKDEKVCQDEKNEE